jgi:hypothetical protein
MSKTLLAVAFIVAAVAVPEILPGLLGVAAGSLAAIAATAAVEVGLSLAANALIGPTTPKGLGAQTNNQVSRLFTTFDTTAPRKIVFGITASAQDMRYQTYTGTNQRYYETIVAHASHKCHSIDEDWFDNEKSWTSAGGVQGRFSGFLTVDKREEGTSSNGIAIDSVWTSACTLTGCAYSHFKYDLLGTATDGSNNSPFASGVTSRVTTRIHGALCYDPRLDSTVAGGSGSQRATDQTTWVWDDNACRNPALQLLWYLLGWKINSKLAVGRGIPSSRIDLASFAVAANACDASIALNGGGTEPRYRSDGVITESDDPQSVIEGLCSTMNAVLRDAGGKLSLTVLTNDLASPVASFTEADVLGGEQWDQTPALSDTFNICRGRRVDPSDNALYQLVDVPEASLTSNDGIDRIDTMDMPFVSSNGQAQRLLKQRLQRKQYQGKYSLTGKARWWQTSLGNIVQMSHAGLGWSNKLFRVAAQSISRDGTAKMTLIEENAAIYAWANNEAAAVTPGTPTVYDPSHSPLLSGVNSATFSSVVIDPFADLVIHASSTGTIKTGELPATLNLTASVGVRDLTTLGAWSRAVTSGVTCTIGAATGALTVTAMTVSEAYIPVQFVYGGMTRNASVHVIVQSDPPSSPTSGSSGSGGSASSTTTLGDTTGSAYDTANAVSPTITCAAGSGGTVACSAPIQYKASNGTSSPIVHGKWQWRVVGGTFADIAAEVADTSEPGNTVVNESTGATRYISGALTVSQSKTGLTAGTNYEFRFLWRDDGTARCYMSAGTLTATGS